MPRLKVYRVFNGIVMNRFFESPQPIAHATRDRLVFGGRQYIRVGLAKHAYGVFESGFIDRSHCRFFGRDRIDA